MAFDHLVSDRTRLRRRQLKVRYWRLVRHGRHADECSLSRVDPRFNGLTITGSSDSQLANPLVKIARNAAADMVHFAGDFGLTPRTRSCLTAAGRVTGPGKFNGLLA